MTTNRPLRVFLCHSSADKPAVRELYQKLRTEPWIQPWLDEEELYPGEDWDLEIQKAIKETDAIIVCVSKTSTTKEGYVQKEIKKALDYSDEKPEGAVFIIPVRLEECQPPGRLSKWQYADYFEGQRGKALEKLLVSLKKRAVSLGLQSQSSELEKELDDERWLKKFSEEFIQRFGEATLSPAETIFEKNDHQEKESITEAFSNNITLSNGMEFMRVPAGKYITGSKEQSTVDIPYDYWMGRFLITNENYYEYVKSKGIKHPVSNWLKKKDHPVTFVSWFDAVDYCNWLNSQYKKNLPDKKLLRLPIRFEWEKAARGIDGRNYPWGNEFDENKCNSWENGRKGTTPVGKYSPYGDSPYGCADMWGNIRIWAHEFTKGRLPGIPENADVRVTCGISYINAGNRPLYIDSFGAIAEDKSRIMGFRLVIAPPLSK